MFNPSRGTHTAPGNHDGWPRSLIYGNGLSCCGGKVKGRHVKGVIAFVHNGLGLLIIVFPVLSENLCCLDGQGAVQIDGDLLNQALPIKLAQDIKNLLCPFHRKGGYDDLFPL